MQHEIIRTDKVIDSEKMYNYSQAIRVGNLIFISGQNGFDPKGNLVGNGNAEAQAVQAMENLKAILEADGAKLSDVVKVNTYVRNIEDIFTVSKIRKRYFKEHKPCHTSVVVASFGLKDLLVEIEAIAVRKQS